MMNAFIMASVFVNQSRGPVLPVLIVAVTTIPSTLL